MVKKTPAPACSLTGKKKVEASAKLAASHQFAIASLKSAQDVARQNLKQLRSWRKAENRSYGRLKRKALNLTKEEILEIAGAKVEAERRALKDATSPKKVKAKAKAKAKATAAAALRDVEPDATQPGGDEGLFHADEADAAVLEALL